MSFKIIKEKYIMKNVTIEKQKMLQKWANLIFGLMTLSSLILSLAILWLNK